MVLGEIHSCFFRNFYAGLRPALVGMIFYAGLSFGTFETLREKAQARDHISFIPIKNERGEINYFVNLVMGKFAAFFNQKIILDFRCDSGSDISIICISDRYSQKKDAKCSTYNNSK